MTRDLQKPCTVLFDGWPLVDRPTSPEALHLLAILEQLPEQVRPVVALPTARPAWLPQVPVEVLSGTQRRVSRLAWEQREIPRLARRLHADLLHLTTPYAPVFSGLPHLFSPCRFGEEQLPGGSAEAALAALRQRLRESLGKGGLARTRAVLWPEDLPSGPQIAPLVTLPPLVYPAFGPSERPDAAGQGNGSSRIHQELDRLQLPETYIIYHGPGDAATLMRLLGAWRWAAGSIGTYHPVLILGLNHEERELFTTLVRQNDYGESLRLLPEVSPPALPMLYRGCQALFHPAPEPPWGGSIRQALACGKPVVAIEHPSIGPVVGPAAYLAPPEDERALGAALITVVVEEEVAASLAQAARKRATAWSAGAYTRALATLYQGLLA